MSSSLKLEPSVDLSWISALHVVIYYISSFKEEGWKYSCRFVFVSFTLQYKLHEKLTIKNNSQILIIYKITPLSTQRKGWST